MPYYVLSIMDNGVRKYYAEKGWITNRGEAIWFNDYQNVQDVVFEEGLDMDEVTIEEGWY